MYTMYINSRIKSIRKGRSTGENTLAFLPNNIDRRVIFDNAIFFASAIINRVIEPDNCGNVWMDNVC